MKISNIKSAITEVNAEIHSPEKKELYSQGWIEGYRDAARLIRKELEGTK
jgi:hypothetical protein